MSAAPWTEFDRMFRDMLTARVEQDPEVLLEHDGGPVGLKADVIFATLYGMDEQIEAEWRIPRVEPYLLMPLRERVTIAAPEPTAMPTMRTARYELQSNWATMNVSYSTLIGSWPADVKPDPTTLMVRVALVRYRRRS